jgi:hypothetical protein
MLLTDLACRCDTASIQHRSNLPQRSCASFLCLPYDWEYVGHIPLRLRLDDSDRILAGYVERWASLAGRRPSFDHVLGDARLRDFEPELEQFAVDARRAPKRIFDAHPADQYVQLRVDLRSPSVRKVQ